MNPGSSERRPLVVGHRGASAALAEHTLGAYLRAIDDGADGLECDVRLTRDGHLVCMHDRRIDRTSDGRGVVSELSLAELSEHDFGGSRPTLPETADELILEKDSHDPQLRRVLTFDRLLDTAIEAPRPMTLLVETKHPTRYGGRVERALVAELERRGLHESVDRAEVGKPRVVMMSFSQRAVRRVRELAPGLDTVLLFYLMSPLRRDGTLPHGAHIAGPGVRMLRKNPGLVARAHAAGTLVYCWTVNQPEDVDLMIDLGVDAIISDRPGFVRRHLERRGL